MPNKYYIDAYNVLHKNPGLQSLANEDLEAARDQLVEQIANFCSDTGVKSVLVFDGQGHNRPQTVNHAKSVALLEVIFSPGHLTADSVIERYVYQESDKAHIAVVSNDRMLRDLCQGMGAMTMDAVNFLTIMRQSHGDVKTTLNRTQKKNPGFLEDQLDEGTLASLQALKKKLK
jgi:predicted RNA-binding protein with PIN domain